MNNTSHITQILDWNHEEKIQFYWIPGHCGIEVNERADLESNQAIKEGK
jgi:ribonuclease HI